MPLEIITLPCLTDNYAYLMRDATSGTVSVVDVPEAGPIIDALRERGWPLHHILITHHHDDHIHGVEELRATTGAAVTGATADAHRLPPLERSVRQGDVFNIGEDVSVIEVPGHTIGHIAFHMPKSGAVFTADSLMALGCGRLFEGTPAMMWDSLSRLAALPGDTMVYSGHEYTASNARFALTIEPENEMLKSRASQVADARADGLPTVPATLSTEISTNPFLRPDQAAIRNLLGFGPNAENAEVFAEIRARKDRF